MDYIERTGLYFLGLVTHRYGLRLYPERLEESLRARAKK